MSLTRSSSARAHATEALATTLQTRLVAACDDLSARHGGEAMKPVSWLRDGGRHGGGRRFVTGDTATFNRASVNVSTVHYDDLPSKGLRSATALSAIVHPDPPRAPSVHTHISYTELRDGRGYWRMMADLNPSIPDHADARAFDTAIERVTGPLYPEARAQGERYFFIGALGRHRGVSHFYLEGHDSGSFEDDLGLAQRFGEAVIDTYTGLVAAVLERQAPITDADRAAQLHYHSVYFFQVLTMDRGTTSGLLVHSDNDVGILGSIPARVDRQQLGAWAAALGPPQDALLQQLVAALPPTAPAVVDTTVKRALAGIVRNHYRAHPEALHLQARGDVVVPTVDNHR